MLKQLVDTNPEVVLDLLRIMASRTSHQLRTPLGTALGVVQDFREGIELEEIDWDDAANALKKILDSLDALRDFAQVKADESVQSDVLLLLKKIIQSSNFENMSILLRESAFAEECVVDEALIESCVRLLFQYFATRFSGDEEKLRLEICADCEKGKPSLCFRIFSNKHSVSESLSIARTLSELAEVDNSIESLSLLLVEAMIAMRGGRNTVRSNDKGDLEFYLLFA